LAFDLPSQRTSGSLHYQVLVRAFADENRWIGQSQVRGSLRLELDGYPRSLTHRFDQPIVVDVPTQYTPRCYAEIELSWQPDRPGLPPLALAAVPATKP
jgi:hypothetical protein